MKYHLKTDISKPPKIFLHGAIYYIRRRLFIDGTHKDVWRSLHTDNAKEAAIAAYRLWYNDQGKTAQELLDKPRIEISAIWGFYIDTERYKLLADSSKRTIKCDFAAFLGFCQAHSRAYFDELDKEFCVKFLSRNDVKNKTFNYVLTELKMIFKQFCVNESAINPFEGIELKSITRGEKRSDSYRMFADAEVLKIFKKLPKSNLKHKDEWLNACRIAAYTGLRYKDVALLQWPFISDKAITLAPHKTANKTEGRKVTIALSMDLKKILNSIERTGYPVLPNLAKSYRDDATKPFSRFLKSIGIVAINKQIAGFHSFRVTFISKATAAGVDLKTIGGIVGHSSEKQTDSYNKTGEILDLSFLKYG